MSIQSAAFWQSQEPSQLQKRSPQKHGSHMFTYHLRAGCWHRTKYPPEGLTLSYPKRLSCDLKAARAPLMVLVPSLCLFLWTSLLSMTWAMRL